MPTDNSSLPAFVNHDQEFSEDQAESRASFASDKQRLETCQKRDHYPCPVCGHEAISTPDRLARIDLRIGFRLLGQAGQALLIQYIKAKRESTRARATAQGREETTDGNQDYHDHHAHPRV